MDVDVHGDALDPSCPTSTLVMSDSMLKDARDQENAEEQQEDRKLHETR